MSQRLLCCLGGILLAVTLTATTASGQTSRPAVVGNTPELLLVGNSDMLWLVRVRERTTTLFRRKATEPFDLGRVFRDRIVEAAPLGGDLFAFTEDGLPFRYRSAGLEAIPERILPGNAVPQSLIGSDDELLAIVPAKVAAALNKASDSTPPRVPDDAPPVVVRYDLRSWQVVTDCPPAAADARDLQLGLAQDRVFLAWLTEDGQVQVAWQLRESDASWSKPFTVPTEQASKRFFFDKVDRQLAVVAIPKRDGDPQAFWLMGSLNQDGEKAWQPGDLQWSDLPEGTIDPTYTSAAGFNQHLVTMATSGGETMLRFARINAAAAEETISIDAILLEPAAKNRMQQMFVSLTVLLLIFVLIGLFAFRRDSMIEPVTVPDGFALAPVSARILAFLVDFVPFSVAAGAMLGVSFSEAMKTLFAWGFSPEQNEMINDTNLLLWWGLSVGGYSVYSLVMELSTGRTVGKVLFSTRVFATDGNPPSPGQLLTRNVMRALELLPHFWVFGLLVILSRNHQRLGDIFARTYVGQRMPLLVVLDDEPEDSEGTGNRE